MFTVPTLTSAGRNLISKALAGATITFTKLGIGNGTPPADPTPLTALVNLCASLQITSILTGSGCASLSGTFDTAQLESSFFASEFGVYADEPDQGEILFAYAVSDGPAPKIAASSSNTIRRLTINTVVAIGDAENVTAILGEFIGYVTIEMFEDHIHNHNNPHQTTKAQVGLSEVPNVSTNNQTPTFTENTADENIESGETLKVLMGKIKRLLRKLLEHLTASNPHNISTTTINAASENHTHAASDITSGTVSVEHGGTGKSSWYKDRLPYPSKTNIFSQVPFPTAADMVLRQNTSGAPFWGYASAVESGSYNGHYIYGSSHKSSIKFKRGIPKIVFIFCRFTGVEYRWGYLIPAAGKGVVFEPPNYATPAEMDSLSDWRQIATLRDALTVSDNAQDTVYWYSTRSQNWQLDGASTFTYDYIGIF